MTWELKIDRIRQEKRSSQSYARTISKYQVYHDGSKVSALSGFFAERQGPGDNTSVGVTKHARIAAGTYSISTHDGSKNENYKTIGYTSKTGIGDIPRPSIRLLNTDKRSGILIHPGNGYLWSIGCFNPAKSMTDEKSNLKFSESRLLVIALIDDLKSFLGNSFPKNNNQTIPKSSVVITGEPL